MKWWSKVIQGTAEIQKSHSLPTPCYTSSVEHKMRTPKAASTICFTLTWVDPKQAGETRQKPVQPAACAPHQPEPLCLPVGRNIASSLWLPLTLLSVPGGGSVWLAPVRGHLGRSAQKEGKGQG